MLPAREETREKRKVFMIGCQRGHGGAVSPSLGGEPAGGLAFTSKNEETSLLDRFSVNSHLGVVFLHKQANVRQTASLLVLIDSIRGVLIRSILVYAERPYSVAPGAGQAFVDRYGHAFAAYKPQRYGSVSTAIIRPDGVVEAMIRDPKSVGVYFEKICA
jgi:hypothetical protein